jgi:S-adenosylmethionine/arginine decarboxylase-like enzyme
MPEEAPVVHVLLDLFQMSNTGKIWDHNYLREICVEAARAMGSTYISHNFGGFGGVNKGIVGTMLLTHGGRISINMIDLDGPVLTIDVFDCAGCDTSKAVDVFLDKFTPASHIVSTQQRGAKGVPVFDTLLARLNLNAMLPLSDETPLQ